MDLLVAAIGSSLFLLILAIIWPGGMGVGDIKLALLMGGVLGGPVIVALFLAFLVGAVVGLILIVTKLKTRKDAIPFGPYLALGSVSPSSTDTSSWTPTSGGWDKGR